MKSMIIYGIVALFFAMATQVTAIPFSSPLEGALNVDAVDNLSSVERATVTPTLALRTTSQSVIGSAAGRATYRLTNETQEALFDIAYDEMSLDPNDNSVRINGIIGFSLDDPVTYMVEGNFSGASESSAVRFLSQTGLSPIGEPELYREVDQEIDGLTVADFRFNAIPEGNFNGGSDLNFGSRFGTLQPGGYEFSYEGLILNMNGGDHRISGSGGVRLRLRAFSEPSAPDELNCDGIPVTAFVLSHTFTMQPIGSPLDNATLAFRHTIDTAAFWQSGVTSLVAVPTTLEIAVDSPTNDALDGTYTALNPTQIVISADRAIFGPRRRAGCGRADSCDDWRGRLFLLFQCSWIGSRDTG